MQTLTNTASIENYAGANEGAEHLDDPLTDDADVTVQTLSVAKERTDTGEPSTDGNNVVIGETVEYTVSITLPEGSANNVILTDTLDSGLAIVSIDSISLTNTAVSGGVTSSEGTWAEIVTASNNSLASPGETFTIDFGTLTNTERDNDDPETIVITYTAVVLNEANNNDEDTRNNSATLTWTGGDPVTDEASNVVIREPDLQVDKEVFDPETLTYVDADTEDAALHLDEGDTIIYRITIEHTNDSSEDAFGVVFIDELPTEGITWSSNPVTWLGAAPNNGDTLDLDASDGTIGATWDQLSYYADPNTNTNTSQSTTFTVTGVLTSASAGQLFLNTGSVTWTSLKDDLDPANDSTTPYNDNGFERTGDETDPGGSANTYSAEDSAYIVVEGSIDKVVSPTEYTIGDEVEYFIKVTLPEGDTNGLIVTDQLPDGLQYISGSATVYTEAGDSDPSDLLEQDFSGTGWNVQNFSVTGGASDGDDIQFQFNSNPTDDAIILAGDDDPLGENDEFVIGFKAIVTNVLTNQDDNPSTGTDEQTDLVNHVSMTYLDPDGITIDPINDPTDPVISVIEPQIDTDKLVSTSPDGGYADTQSDIEAGSTLYYQVTLENSGNATAFEVTAEDILPDGVTLDDATLLRVIDSSGVIDDTGATIAAPTVWAQQTGDTVTLSDALTGDGWDIESNGYIVLQYAVSVGDSIAIGSTHINAVDADWSSQNGTDNPEDRNYIDEDIYNVDQDLDEDTAEFTNPAVLMTKTDDTETATIGDTVTYTLNIDAPQGTLTNFELQDTISAGMTFDPASVQITSANFPDPVSQDVTTDASGNTIITWDFGDTPIHNDQNDITITYQATVANIVANQDDQVIDNDDMTNSAIFAYENPDDGTTIDNTADPATDAFDIVEPQITTGKTVSDPPIPDAGVQPNDVLTYTITLENTGSADAYEVTAEDILPDGVILYTDTTASDYIAPAASGTDDITINDGGDGTLFITNSSGEGWDIAQGTSVIITYQVQVKGAAYVVGAHTNYVDADWTGQDGDPTTSDGIERVYDDGETQPLWPGEDGTQDEATADFITQVNPPIVGDFVWFDVNGDGVQDAGEPGISGVEINLYGNDGNGNTVLFATAVTDENGWYEFDRLPLTNNEGVPPYLIQVDTDTLPDGLAENQTAEKADALKPGSSQEPESGLNNQTYFDVLTTADNLLDIDFGYTASGTIGDTVWYDTNLNGLQDETGTGIAGAEVTLQGDLDGDGIYDYTATTTTDNNGEYSFTNLPFVDYEVTVTSLPGGLSLQTGDPDATLDSRHEVTLSDTTPAVDTVDFGYVGSGSIGDTVWANNNGDDTVDAGESGLANVEVILTGDVNFDGILDTFTTFTDGNGNYSFTNLPEGDYTVTVNTTTLPGGLTAAGANYDLDGGNDSTTSVTLAADENITDVDFGFGDSDFGSIGDIVWLDINGDGNPDGGNEIGLSEVTVNLIDDTGTIIDTATTDADGSYFFGSLPYGDYTVEVDNTSLPDGLTQTYDLTGAQDDHSATVTIDATQQNWDTVDFGYQGDGSIGDTVWLEMDNVLDPDGNQTPDVESDDFGLANVDVTLEIDIDGDGIFDASMTTTTGTDGSYEFNGLPFTNYKVIIDADDLPEGVDLIADPDSGTMGDVPNESILTLTSDDHTNDSQDFGYQGTGSIGDTVWNNTNGNNLVDGSETGINNVEVILTGDFNNDGVVSDDESITYTTENLDGDDGQYLFENLPEGDYTVTVDTTDPNLSGLNPNYDADGGNDATTDVALAAGENNTDVDFGFSDRGSIGDTIWLDTNGDGVQDPTEVGISGVTVTLIDGVGVETSVETDSDGHYYFGDLDTDNDTYTVVVDNTTLPSGIFQTYDPDGIQDHSSEITLTASNQNVDTIDFGYRGQGRVGDTVWLDLDNNGEPNVGAGDFGLAGVDITLTVALVDNAGDPTGSTATFTTTTDAYGQYLFEGLPYGEYTVTLDESDLPGNVSLVSDPENDSDNTSSFTLDDTTTSNLDQDFGYRGTGSIGDTVWFDEDADGNVTPDEGPLGDDPVTLILTGDFNNDGVVGPDEQIRVETDTSDGTYIFEGLANGEYTVRVDPTTIPDGYEQSGDRDDTLDNRTAVTLSSDNNVITDADFGYTTVSSIGDTVWFDYDGDGVQDADEPGLAGVTVTLTDEDGNTFIDSTDENGNYLFSELNDGTYTVTIDTSTLPTTGLEPTADLDGIATANSATLTLENGQSNMDVDFGYTGTGSVGDTLWNDENQNGVQDGGEAGLPGVEITVGIDLDGDNTPDYTVTTTTDSNGNYLIDNLPAGSHIVTVDPATLPEGITPSFDPDGTLDNSFTVTLSPGQNVDTVDFGYVYPPKSSPAPFAPVAPLPVTPSEPDTTLTVDAYLLNYLFGGERGDIFDYFQREWDETYQPQILPVAPIYSGRAEPGTTLALTLLDAEGNELSSQSVMADTAGNWIANFSGSLLYDVPHQMVIKQSISSYNNSTQGLFNMRTHFNPTFASLVFSDIALDVNTIMASLPSTIIKAIHDGNNQTLNLHWDNFAGYEFFTSSTNPSQHSH